MSKYVHFLRLIIFTAMLYILVAEVVEFPGEKQGEAKKDFILRSFNEGVDSKFPNTPWIDFIQAWVSKAIGKLVDWLVAKAKAEGGLDKIKAEVLSFF